MDVLIATYDTKTIHELEQILPKLGHNIQCLVSSGEEAVEITAKTGPDLVLIDLDLRGEIKGVDAGKKITDNLKVPVIFITVFTKNCLTMSLQLPEDAVTVSKPLKQDHLKYAISNILRTKNKKNK
jgi:two-component SAPR family response regulator